MIKSATNMTLMEAFVPRDGEQFPRHESEARAPVYNAEDYTGYMRKHCKLTNIHMYIHPDTRKKKCGKGKQEKSENKNSSLNKERLSILNTRSNSPCVWLNRDE